MATSANGVSAAWGWSPIMAKIEFKFKDIELRRGVEDMEAKVDRAMKATSNYHAVEGTAHMKEHAPWTDRTGAARAGLHAVASTPQPDRYEIVFAHTVHYGIWLEIANSGRYEIIMPTVHHEGKLMAQRLRGLLGRLR